LHCQVTILDITVTHTSLTKIENRKRKQAVAKRRQHKDFEQILIAAIDEALSSLGENVKTSIYYHLEESFKVKRQDIPQKIDDFIEALERIFGPGARHIEILFIQSLHAKIGVTCKWPTHESPLRTWVVPEMTFQEYVHLIQQNFEDANENKIEMGVLLDEHEETQK
jgi:DNA-binding FrmR family transcriptional regulator